MEVKGKYYESAEHSNLENFKVNVLLGIYVVKLEHVNIKWSLA